MVSGFIPVVQSEPRHVQQRLEEVHHGVVVWPGDNPGQCGEVDDKDSGDERGELRERLAWA